MSINRENNDLFTHYGRQCCVLDPAPDVYNFVGVWFTFRTIIIISSAQHILHLTDNLK